MVSSVVAWICFWFCFQVPNQQCVMVPLPCGSLCLCCCSVSIGGTGGGGIGGGQSGMASLLGEAIAAGAIAAFLQKDDRPASPGE
jgi:hypothetical protein